MVCNCNYNKVKIFYKVSKLIGFIDKHAVKDAEKDGHPLCAEEYRELKKSLEAHAGNLRMAIEGLSREGKFG